MTDWGASGRRDSYRFVLVDPFTLMEDKEIECDAASSSITYGYYTDNKAQASISTHNSDWQQSGTDMLVRVYHRCQCDGADVEECLGTFFVDSAPTKALYRRESTNLSCYSTLWRYTQDVLLNDFARPVGYNVVQEMREIVEWKGGKLKVDSDVDSGRLHTVPIWFEMGTNNANVLNTIAGWIGAQIGVDPYGYVTLSKYVNPSDKPVSYTFVEGDNCTYLPGIDFSRDIGNPINRVKAYFSRDSKQDDDPYPLSDYHVAELPDAEEFSYARCGRCRTVILRVDQPCWHHELVSKAETHLRENSNAIQYINIEHVGIPGLSCGDKVRYVNSTDSVRTVDVDAVVAEMSVSSLGPGMKCSTKLKVVKNNGN